MQGPPSSGYSWLFGAAVISLVVSYLVPRKWAKRLGQAWIWGVPVALLVVIFVYQRRWFY